MLQVTCAVIMQEDRFLCAQRSELMRHPLKWEFPGGKVEMGEKLHDCIVREVREELNLTISVRRILSRSIHNYEDGTTVVLYPFICHVEKNALVLLEHKEVRWLNRSELPNLDWVGGDLPVVREVLQLYQ